MLNLKTSKNEKTYFDHLVTVDTYEWLELGDELPAIQNPILRYQSIDRSKPVQSLIKFLMEPAYLPYAAKTILNVELLPFQCAILDVLWNKKMVLDIASRGGSKSFGLAVYNLLAMLFDPGTRIVIVGAAFRQARRIHDYMCEIWEKAPILRDIAGRGKSVGPKKELDRMSFRIGDSTCIALPLGSGEKIRGERGQRIIADEAAMIPEEIFNVVVQGFGVVSKSPVDKVKESFANDRLKRMGMWTEEMENLRLMALSGNQMIFSGSAFFQFNHLYRKLETWRAIIASRGDRTKLAEIVGDDVLIQEGLNWKDYAIIRIPYNSLPPGFLDPAFLSHQRATLSPIQFLMEMGACFVRDTDGFFKRSILEAATTTRPVTVASGKTIQFSPLRKGDIEKSYVLGIDPAAHRDNAAIVTVEVNEDHCKVVNCWSTNKKRFEELKKHGIVKEDDYYKFIMRKIKNLMASFNVQRICIDQHGGGTAIVEALGDQANCSEGEYPIYEGVDQKKEKFTDSKEGLHIIEVIKPTVEYNSEANHGLLKDIQEKFLLFPAFDTIELERSLAIDEMNSITYDTYEDLCFEIEELKTEMTTIICMPTSKLGLEHFDTPEVILDSTPNKQKKGRLRKDRYSALLYANMWIRSREKNDPFVVRYVPVGGTKDTFKRSGKRQSMYTGPGIGDYQNSGWLKSGGGKSVKHK